MTDNERLQELNEYWRNRSNAFELALREIVAERNLDSEELASDRWEIAKKALDNSK